MHECMYVFYLCVHKAPSLVLTDSDASQTHPNKHNIPPSLLPIIRAVQLRSLQHSKPLVMIFTFA